MKTIILKNRRWRIELYVVVCDDVFKYDENEKRKFYFVEFDIRKISTYNIFDITFSI